MTTESTAINAPRVAPPSDHATPEIPYTGAGRSTVGFQMARTLCRVVTSVMFDLKVYGAHHIPRTGGVLLVSNHQTYLDPVLMGVASRRPLSYLAKSELFENKFFGGLIRWLNAFPVRQGAGDFGAMKQTIARLQQGHVLNIFPEGTRTSTGEMLPIEKGVGLVVRKAGVPVVPAVIDGSYRAWPRGDAMFHSTPIRIWIGRPMELSKLRGEEIVRRIDVTLREMFTTLRAHKVPPSDVGNV